ncbi:hypothetical protein A3K01_03980 [candidate division WWE3 bacterium RIFOXYD1_FULL_43_17]|uniref:Uncharacterized protein n=2 Tax=Katanobacteria TaxID=422282 RepID=A0A1F4XDX4_UNCKA|nr:MAG: hypothetical protein UR43_C0017G0024 [candidate division TM6 bacterium GW2011_GWF2_33_332]KKS03235.1 MAG: hypothetical protein UU55_C0004G0024 [candidate division WWE3 bacterium GW2011_GWC2_41_23]OGC79857.1 MAG: hypothetical protein A3K01_03980 [candidate division WWE3 bacterium RIFOXYD1_FULL_43_17]
MNILETKSYVESFIASSNGKKYTPDEMINMIKKYTNITLGDENPVSGTPSLGYINSNIKGVYYIIYCDACNAKCRKSYPTILNINGNKVMKFLCGSCAGKKYERKKEYERKALEYLLHPEKLGSMNYRNLSLKQSLAILEAGFIEDKIRERAEKNASKYLGDS